MNLFLSTLHTAVLAMHFADARALTSLLLFITQAFRRAVVFTLSRSILNGEGEVKIADFMVLFESGQPLLVIKPASAGDMYVSRV